MTLLVDTHLCRKCHLLEYSVTLNDDSFHFLVQILRPCNTYTTVAWLDNSIIFFYIITCLTIHCIPRKCGTQLIQLTTIQPVLATEASFFTDKIREQRNWECQSKGYGKSRRQAIMKSAIETNYEGMQAVRLLVFQKLISKAGQGERSSGKQYTGF